jgi:hypothetical protein
MSNPHPPADTMSNPHRFIDAEPSLSMDRGEETLTNVWLGSPGRDSSALEPTTPVSFPFLGVNDQPVP